MRIFRDSFFMGEELKIRHRSQSTCEYSDDSEMTSQDMNFISEVVEYDNEVHSQFDQNRGTTWNNGYRRSMREHGQTGNQPIEAFKAKLKKHQSTFYRGLRLNQS